MEIIVIGGGPAGLFSAITAAETGCKVMLLEKHPSIGRKLLASGGGKCNLTNAAPVDTMAAAFGKNFRFTLPALRNFDGTCLREWFRIRGVPTVLTDGFHYFPASGKSGDLLAVLSGELKRLGVTIVTGETAVALDTFQSSITGVITQSGRHFSCQKVILAAEVVHIPP